MLSDQNHRNALRRNRLRTKSPSMWDDAVLGTMTMPSGCSSWGDPHFPVCRRGNHDVISHTGIFVDDGVFNAAIVPDANAGPTGFFVFDN